MLSTFYKFKFNKRSTDNWSEEACSLMNVTWLRKSNDKKIK